MVSSFSFRGESLAWALSRGGAPIRRESKMSGEDMFLGQEVVRAMSLDGV